jgi:lysophospholipase L1-like esterase
MIAWEHSIAVSEVNSTPKRAFLFRLGAICLGLLPFIMLEAGLRFSGAGKAGPQAYSGAVGSSPLFERQGPNYCTVRAREPFFCRQEFPVQKPGDGFRVFCFGGSTVYGHPYLGDTSFPKWLELELSARAPNRSIQVINCGGVSYASYRIAPLVKEVLSYRPDLIVVATGENEFLEDRTYAPAKKGNRLRASLSSAARSLRTFNVLQQALQGTPDGNPNSPAALAPAVFAGEVEPRLDRRSGYGSYHRDEAWQDRVAAQLEQSLREMVQGCRGAGVSLLLVNLGSNLRDCPPFKSEHKVGLTTEEETAWQEAFDAATSAASENLALALYRSAEAIDAEHPLLAYRIARLLDRLGKPGAALVFYLRARDLDICPLRTTSRHEQVLATVAGETKTPLLNAASLLAADCPGGIAGFDRYVDHVHPDIAGHQKIAQALVEQITGLGLIGDLRPCEANQRRELYAKQMNALSPSYLADGRRRVDWLENWARRNRLLEETVPQDADGYVRLALRQSALGDEEGAMETLREAARRDLAVGERLRLRSEQLRAEGREECVGRLLKACSE